MSKDYPVSKLWKSPANAIKERRCDIGAKPSKGTKADMRLKCNNPNIGKPKPKPMKPAMKKGKERV